MAPNGDLQADRRLAEGAASGEEDARWASLVRRILAGDRDAEEAIARHFHRMVLTMASVRLHGSDAAQDIAQDTLLAVLEAVRTGRLREPERLPAFVLGTARNLVNNHFRRAGVNPARPGDPPADPPAAVTNQPGVDAERRAMVRASLVRLKPLDRRILLLTLTEGLTPREIAPIVNLTPEVVRTRKSRATRTLVHEVGMLTRPRRSRHIE